MRKKKIDQKKTPHSDVFQVVLSILECEDCSL